MPIYGHGLVYESSTRTAKDAGVAPDSGSYPVWSGFGQAESPNRTTGLIVGLATVLSSVALFVLTLRLGRSGG